MDSGGFWAFSSDTASERSVFAHGGAAAPITGIRSPSDDAESSALMMSVRFLRRHPYSAMTEPAPTSEDPSSLTRWVVAHLVLGALVCWLAMFVMALGLFDGEHPVAWLAASAGFGLLIYGLWRPGGPGHALRAYVLRRFPAKERREQT
jgi:hypothetical protein